MNSDYLTNTTIKKILSITTSTSGIYLTAINDTALYESYTFSIFGNLANAASVTGVDINESDNANMSNSNVLATDKIIGKIDFALSANPVGSTATIGIFSTKRYVRLRITCMLMGEVNMMVVGMGGALVVPV